MTKKVAPKVPTTQKVVLELPVDLVEKVEAHAGKLKDLVMFDVGLGQAVESLVRRGLDRE
jgi:hypothetical protein